jgi:hypothetical protein
MLDRLAVACTDSPRSGALSALQSGTAYYLCLLFGFVKDTQIPVSLGTPEQAQKP